MTTSTKLLMEVCQDLGLKCQKVDPEGFVLRVGDTDQAHFVLNNTLGLVSDTDAALAKDKAFQAQLLQNTNLVPISRSYLDPASEYSNRDSLSLEQINQDIESSFSIPFILKKNSGSRGKHVFKVEKAIEILPTLQKIFDQKNAEYDHVALAQKYIEPKNEYRVIIFNGRVELVYKKTFNEGAADLTSENRWKKTQATLVKDLAKLEQLQKLVTKLYIVWPLKYAGLDIVEDDKQNLWLIEVNTHPSLAYFVRDNGPLLVKQLYKKILTHIFSL